MHICSKCGAHYNSNFYACPQCGNAKYETEDKDSPGSKLVGSLVSIGIVLVLIGIIGYGYYIYKNPYDAGPTTTDVDWESYGISTTTTTTTSQKPTTSTTAKVTTTKLVGETYSSSGHSMTLPNGFVGRDSNVMDVAGGAATYICAYNSMDEKIYYCYNYQEGINVSIKDKDAIDILFNSQGYSELKNNRFNTMNLYYSYKDMEGGYISSIVYYNKGANLITSTISIKASEINDESLSTYIDILKTYK